MKYKGEVGPQVALGQQFQHTCLGSGTLAPWCCYLSSRSQRKKTCIVYQVACRSTDTSKETFNLSDVCYSWEKKALRSELENMAGTKQLHSAVLQKNNYCSLLDDDLNFQEKEQQCRRFMQHCIICLANLNFPSHYFIYIARVCWCLHSSMLHYSLVHL